MIQNCHCKLKSIYCPFQQILPYNVFQGNRGYKLSKQTRKNVYCTKFEIANFDSKQYRKKEEKDKFSFILMSHVKVDFIYFYCQVDWRYICNSIHFYASDYFLQCEIQISPNLVCRLQLYVEDYVKEMCRASYNAKRHLDPKQMDFSLYAISFQLPELGLWPLTSINVTKISRHFNLL